MTLRLSSFVEVLDLFRLKLGRDLSDIEAKCLRLAYDEARAFSDEPTWHDLKKSLLRQAVVEQILTPNKQKTYRELYGVVKEDVDE